MLFVTVEDFFKKAESCHRLSRTEEIECARWMKGGDLKARERLIESYLPFVAGYIRHTEKSMQTFGLALYCVDALEKAVDSFNFLQEGETFVHRLSWHLRQAMTQYIVR